MLEGISGCSLLSPSTGVVVSVECLFGEVPFPVVSKRERKEE